MSFNSTARVTNGVLGQSRVPANERTDSEPQQCPAEMQGLPRHITVSVPLLSDRERTRGFNMSFGATNRRSSDVGTRMKSAMSTIIAIL